MFIKLDFVSNFLYLGGTMLLEELSQYNLKLAKQLSSNLNDILN